jgi:hypothetical protein
MHESDPNDQLARRALGNTACTQCHEQFAEPAVLTAHTHHAAGSAGSECYNCHMPHTSYGILKAIRSHEISSPRATDDLSSGRPNACNLCHVDKTLDWTATRLEEWYQQKKPAMPAGATNVSRAVQLALSGNAGQRVLVAWHLGWNAALEASGTNWVAPVLAQLLDDPYAAVRCVAERSLRSISKFVPADYDYTVDPKSRPRVRERIWESWQSDSSAGGMGEARLKALLLSPGDPAGQRQAFDYWLGFRDHTPIRLRE